MAMPKFSYFCFGRTALTCLLVSIALGVGRADENEEERAQPKLTARLLFVQREWADQGGEQIRKEVIDALQDETPNENVLAVNESDVMGVGTFLPEAGHAAVFKPQDFESLVQWLRARELLVDEKVIELEATRFENRWRAAIHPVLVNKARTDLVWHLGVELAHSDDPAAVGSVIIKRTHSRSSPKSGPQLRGAAVDIRKTVSFFLPQQRVVAMTWYAHPQDKQRAPTLDQRVVEPVLVLQEGPASDATRPAEAVAKFHRPERVIDLLLE